MSSIQDATDAGQKHWLVILFGGAVAVAGITWEVSQNIQVSPRDRQITQLQKQIEELNQKTNNGAEKKEAPSPSLPLVKQVMQGTSITSDDGNCEVAVESAWDGLKAADLLITVGSHEPKRFSQVKPGFPVAVEGYSIHVLGVSANIATISISKSH